MNAQIKAEADRRSRPRGFVPCPADPHACTLLLISMPLITLIGGPLAGRTLTTAVQYKPGEYMRVVGPKNLEHVYRFGENTLIAFWVHS